MGCADAYRIGDTGRGRERYAPACFCFAVGQAAGLRYLQRQGSAGSHQQSFHCAEIKVREPPIASLPANIAREPSVFSIRMASFHFAIRSERENEPTLS